MTIQALGEKQVRAALEQLPGWTHEQNQLTRTFRFGGFKEAVSFIVRLAMHAEQMQHHPELHNVYNRVTVSLCTHDAADKVTERDVELARRIQQFDWTEAQEQGNG